MTQKRGKTIFALLPLSFVIIYVGAIPYFIDIGVTPYFIDIADIPHFIVVGS